MLKVGITGGIGTGKTTVCRIFEVLGIPVYYADSRAKALMINDPLLVANIKKLLGEEAYLASGELNRAYVASQIFANPQKLEGINQLVHPAVAIDYESWHQAQHDVPFTLKEAAILFESGSHIQHDKIICVTAPLEIRIERVMKRDSASREQVLSRIDKQWPEVKKIALSDFVIHNNNVDGLIEQVREIYTQLQTDAPTPPNT